MTMKKQVTQAHASFLTLEKSTNLLRCVALKWYLSDCKMNVIIVLITPATATPPNNIILLTRACEGARLIPFRRTTANDTFSSSLSWNQHRRCLGARKMLPCHRVCRSSIKQLQISSWHASDLTDGCFDCAMLCDFVCFQAFFLVFAFSVFSMYQIQKTEIDFVTTILL